jgi:hypothetical protein
VPHLKELHSQYKDQGLVLIGVHTMKGGSKAHDYVKAKGIDYPVCVDSSGSTVRAFRANSFPDYYVIDRNGVLRYADLVNSHVDDVVKKLLAEPAPGSTPLSLLRAMVANQPEIAFQARMVEGSQARDLVAALRQTFGEDEEGPWLEVESVMVDRKKVLPVLRHVVRMRADEDLTLMRHRIFVDGKLTTDLVHEKGKLKGRLHGETVLRNVPAGLTHESGLLYHSRLLALGDQPTKSLTVLLNSGRVSGKSALLTRLKADPEQPGVIRISWDSGLGDATRILDFDAKGRLLGMTKRAVSKRVAPLELVALEGEAASQVLKRLFSNER